MTLSGKRLIKAAQQARADLQTVHRCKACNSVVTVAEFIEKHCNECRRDTDFVASKEKVA